MITRKLRVSLRLRSPFGLRASLGRARDARGADGRQAQSAPAARDPYWANSYFTDGIRLYRFVGWLGNTVGAALAEFEDCCSLNVIVVRVDGHRVPGFRPVGPGRR